MTAAPPAISVNRLIQALSSTERGRFLARCEPVDITFGDILCEPGEQFTHVYFPLTGFVSLVATVSHHEPLEMGLIGNEGMLGATLTLGVNAVPLRGVVQGTGTALRVPVSQFLLALKESVALQRVLQRYLYVLMAQLSQSAACTRFHEVDARLARWLLMTHDRAHANHFHLTHKFLAAMLGVRRSGVTIAAGVLQQRGVLRYTRGEITILDRAALETAACECYAAVVEDYAHILG